MYRFLRRVGIAIGSLVAASLVMGLVTGVIVGITGPQLQASGAAAVALAFVGVLTLVLAGLIYRDIMEREDREP